MSEANNVGTVSEANNVGTVSEATNVGTVSEANNVGTVSEGTSRPTPFEAVGEFHAAFAVRSRTRPTLDVPAAELSLRQDLLDEEVGELRDSVAARDLVGIADALADIVYIACGTAQALGIPFDDVFAEVHRANMSKLGPDGRPLLRPDGKVLKGPAYTPPDVAAVLRRSGAEACDTPRR